MNNFIRILIFSFIYYCISNESFVKIGCLFLLVNISLIFLDYFQKKSLSFQYLLFISFLLLLPLSLNNYLQSTFLPYGYKYIYISLISSLIYIDSKKINLETSFQKRLYTSFLALFAPSSYVSGPSATYKEIENMSKGSFGLPSMDFLKFSTIKLFISGGFRISLGIYLDTLNLNIFNHSFLFGEDLIFPKIPILIISGFYNFWRYYLLFSGASELCKSL